MQNIITTILTSILITTPVSYFVILFFKKIKPESKKINNIDLLISDIPTLLLTNKEKIRSIVYNGKKTTIKKNSEPIQKNEATELMLQSTIFCKFDKTKEIENEIITLFKNNNISPNNFKYKFKILQEIEHTEGFKITTKIIQNKETKEIFAVSKGNIAALRLKCTKYFNKNKKEELTENILNTMLKPLIENGEKILAFAYKPLPLKQQKKYTKEFCEREMTLTGLIGSIPPINKKLKPDFDLLKEKNINKILITKEPKFKALKIAKESSFIENKHYISIESQYLIMINDKKLEKILEKNKKEIIFSNISPNQENRIIKTLEKLNIKHTHTKKINSKNKIKLLINILEKQKENKIHEKNIKSFIFSYKISLIILFITSISLKAPIPFTLGSILIIEIFFTLLMSLLKKTTSAKLKTENFITKSILRGLALSILYITILASKGFNLSTTITQSDSAFIYTHSIIFIIIITFLTTSIHSNFKLKKENIYLILGTIISILATYSVIKFPNSKELVKLEIPNLEAIKILAITIAAGLLAKTHCHLKQKNGN